MSSPCKCARVQVIMQSITRCGLHFTPLASSRTLLKSYSALPYEDKSITLTVFLFFLLSLSLPLLTVLSPVQVYMARCSPPAPAGPVHPIDDGLLHRPLARLRPQAPSDRRPGGLCAGSPGGLLHSECSHVTQHNT